MLSNIYLVIAVVVAILFGSCVSTKKAIYFNNIPDSTIRFTIQSLEPVIQNNDLLSISVSSLNSTATEIFNAPNIAMIQTSTAAGGNMTASGYLVDQEGFIKFPVLGNIKGAGLTKKALSEDITKRLIESKQLLDPIVNVRYLNYKVTVLGEVSRPSVINVPNEKITLLEALGLAGDLTLYAKRDNIMVLREEGPNKVIKRLNLNSSEVLTSPYFYLKSNDVVYVEPNKIKVGSTSRVNQWLPVILSALTLGIVLADRLIQ